MKIAFWLSLLVLFTVKSQILKGTEYLGKLLPDYIAAGVGACIVPWLFYFAAKKITKSSTKGYAVGLAIAVISTFLLFVPLPTLVAKSNHQTLERLIQKWDTKEYQNQTVEDVAKRQHLDKEKKEILREHMSQILPVLKDPVGSYLLRNQEKLGKLTEEELQGTMFRALSVFYDKGRGFLTPDEVWTNLQVEERIREILPPNACKKFVIAGSPGLNDKELAEVESSLYRSLPNDLYAAALRNQRKAAILYLKGETPIKLSPQEEKLAAQGLENGFRNAFKGVPVEQVKRYIAANSNLQEADPETVCKLGQYTYEALASLKGPEREAVLRFIALSKGEP